jgi:hypothetical protein
MLEMAWKNTQKKNIIEKNSNVGRDCKQQQVDA